MFKKNKMWLKKNNIITFDKDDKVVVIASAKHNGREYYLVLQILPDESDITNNYNVMEAFIEEKELRDVTDLDLILELKSEFMKNVRSYNDRIKHGVKEYFSNAERSNIKRFVYAILNTKEDDVIGFGNNNSLVKREPGEDTQTFYSRAEKILNSDTGVPLTGQNKRNNIKKVTIGKYLQETNTRDFETLYYFAYQNPECFYYIKDAAEHGDVAAKHWCAMCYDDGYGVEENLETAFQMMKEAAECGSPKSFVELGRMYDAEVYGHYSHEKAVYWLNKALECGFKEVAFRLSLKYRYGLGVEKDLDEADRLEKIYNGSRKQGH